MSWLALPPSGHPRNPGTWGWSGQRQAPNYRSTLWSEGTSPMGPSRKMASAPALDIGPTKTVPAASTGRPEEAPTSATSRRAADPPFGTPTRATSRCQRLPVAGPGHAPAPDLGCPLGSHRCHVSLGLQGPITGVWELPGVQPQALGGGHSGPLRGWAEHPPHGCSGGPPQPLPFRHETTGKGSPSLGTWGRGSPGGGAGPGPPARCLPPSCHFWKENVPQSVTGAVAGSGQGDRRGRSLPPQLPARQPRRGTGQSTSF